MQKKHTVSLLFGFFVATFIVPMPTNSVFAGSADLTEAQCAEQGGLCKGGDPWICPSISTEKSVGFCPSTTTSSAELSMEIRNCCVLKSTPSATTKSTVASTTTPEGSLNYTLLEKLPGFNSTSGSDLPGYIKAVYGMALAVIVLSALFMLSVGGFMYLASAGNTSAMHTAKDVIYDALIGLVIALTAWLLLNVINPDLVNINIRGLVVAPTPVGAPAAGIGVPGSCGGLTPQSGISCGDASQKLSDLLTCMKGKGVTTTVSSIGDSAGFNTCKNSWSKPPCAHAATSCHYGGGVSKAAAECQKSHAADLSVRNSSGGVDLALANSIKSAASACGGQVNDETNLPGVAPHIHVSDQTSCCTL